MSVQAVPASGQVAPAERRRSTRVPLEIALQLVIDGEVHAARTVLGNREGVLVYSPRLCTRGSIIEARNAATGRSTQVRVAWCWVEREGEAKTIRLALESAEAGPGAWEPEYEERLQEGKSRGDWSS
jgi:hypothetical protein